MERIFHANWLMQRTSGVWIERKITCVYERNGAKITGKIAIYNPSDAYRKIPVLDEQGNPSYDDFGNPRVRFLSYTRRGGVAAARVSNRTFTLNLPTEGIPFYREKKLILDALREMSLHDPTCTLFNFNNMTIIQVI